MTEDRTVIGRAVSCGNKVRYLTRAQAKQARKQHKGIGPLNIYRCVFCHLFHLGHMPDDVRRGTVDKAVWQTRRRGL